MILDGNSKIITPKVYASTREMELEKQLVQKDKIIAKLKTMVGHYEECAFYDDDRCDCLVQKQLKEVEELENAEN